MPAPLAGLEQAPHVLVDGTAIAAALFDAIVECTVVASVTSSGIAELRFDDADRAMAAMQLGKRLVVKFDDVSNNAVEVFAGAISSVSIDAGIDRRDVVVVAYDDRAKLGNGVKTRSFVNVSYSDVLTTIAGESGLTGQIDSALTTVVHAELYQFGTNRQFVDEIARRTGMEWYVADGKLVVGPRATTASVSLELGEGLTRFTARYSGGEHASEVTVRGWNPQDKAPVTGTAAASVARTASSRTSIELSNSAKDEGRRPVQTWRHTVLSQNEAEQVAAGIAHRMVSGSMTGRGEAWGTPALVPGRRCTITALGDDWSGDYYVSEVEHVYGRGQPYTTRFRVGSIEHGSLVDLAGGGQAGAAPFTGVAIGLVTNNKPANGAPAWSGVKVEFPYLVHEGRKVESAWARVASPDAGPTRGLLALPEVNDEVLVAFEQGDVRRPYVIGRLWNGQDATPDTPDALVGSDGKVVERVMKSRVGHRLRFLDGTSDATKAVTIELADGVTKVHVAHDKIEVIANNKPIELKTSQASVLLTGEGDVKVSGTNVEVKATTNLKLEASTAVEIKAPQVKVDASGTMTLKSSGMAEVSAGAMLVLKGSMVKIN